VDVLHDAPAVSDSTLLHMVSLLASQSAKQACICVMLAHSLEEQAQNHHVVNTTLAVGIVSQHGHEGKQQAHKAILQDERADGDLPVCHVTGTAVL